MPKSSLLAATAQDALKARLTNNMPPAEVVTIHNKVIVQRSASNRGVLI